MAAGFGRDAAEANQTSEVSTNSSVLVPRSQQNRFVDLFSP